MHPRPEVLVTGGAGFVGSHLVRQLAKDQTVAVLEKPGANLGRLADLVECHRVEIRPADIRNRAETLNALAGCKKVYHLAANPRLWTYPKGEFLRVNYHGSRHVLEGALRLGARRVLHCSTESILTRAKQAGAIGADQVVPPDEVVGPYCKSKHRAEVFALALGRKGHPVVVVNPTLPVGPGDPGSTPPGRLILDFCLGKRREVIQAEVNLVDVRDAGTAMRLALEGGQPGRRYLLGGENFTIRQLFEKLAAITGLPGPRFTVPWPVALLAAWVEETAADVFTRHEPAATLTGVILARRRMSFEAGPSLQALGASIRPAEESLRDAVLWLAGQGLIPMPAKTAQTASFHA
jgi:dihydroflavonol-4-reductase